MRRTLCAAATKEQQCCFEKWKRTSRGVEFRYPSIDLSLMGSQAPLWTSGRSGVDTLRHEMIPVN